MDRVYGDVVGSSRISRNSALAPLLQHDHEIRFLMDNHSRDTKSKAKWQMM